MAARTNGKSFTLSDRLMLHVAALCIIAFTQMGCATSAVPERLKFLGYQGKVNEHKVFIHAPPSRVFALLTDFNHFPSNIPSDRIRVTKTTPGPYGIGTTIHTETGYKIKIGWNSRVVDMRQDSLLVLQFLDGIFQGGYEVWELGPEGSGTQLSHTIVYNVANLLYRSLWVLKKGEAKHDTLVEATLSKLKQCCETGSDRIAMTE